MTTKHTAGPWEVAEGHAGWLVVGDVKATSHVVIADVPDEDDARLIATAPDLLAAAKDALAGWHYIRATHGELYGVGWDRVEQALTAAISRASR